jgi:predicted double-glycine peptidase
MRPRYHPIRKGGIRIAVPDTTQQKGYSCGASALQAVCHYYGVGGEEEDDFALAMDLKSTGSDPCQLVDVAQRYGLKVIECQPMKIAELKRALDLRHPVIIMMQAWGEGRGQDGYRKSYKRIWEDGHWVVAIGYDRTGVFFEDPSLQALRGYLSFAELDERWHDVGPPKDKGHIEHYGMIVWKPGARKSMYDARARRIP